MLPEVLKAARGPELQSIVGVIWSFLVEASPAFRRMRPATKRVCIAFLCLAIPLLATGCSIALGYEAGPSAWEEAIEAGFAAYFASQVAHLRKLRGKDARDVL